MLRDAEMVDWVQVAFIWYLKRQKIETICDIGGRKVREESCCRNYIDRIKISRKKRKRAKLTGNIGNLGQWVTLDKSFIDSLFVLVSVEYLDNFYLYVVLQSR